ncbi:MDR family NADP-dependent oxidoreductase [Burkholderia ubonensis]|uniref:MDR family NADP-dependent oxidoreductase n=1 Tax=Burkholderia ubonensis TaxID=101571 RepID=UPI0007559B3E|nr:NADP-dependent oxidoreductase [Burkholderia ubonensis]KVD09000.1 2-alkenal reductase [Burkholderia ubonensis]
MSIVNRQILLVSRPQGAASVDNFRLVETPLAPLANGEVRVRNHFLSLDPYMRGRMNDAKSYAPPQPLNEVMIGGTAGEVIESRHPGFAVGIAGGPDKCRYVVEALGFDACVDYKAGRLVDDLAAATPDGVDGCFENVGGAVLDATMARMNAFGRIAVCGMIAAYDGASAPLAAPALILRSRLKMQGFIVFEHPDAWPPALAELTELVASKHLHYRESIAYGLERAPEAFLGMLKGRNFGKQLVQLV